MNKIYCLDCNRLLSIWAYTNKSVRCRSCAQRNNKKDPTTCHFYKDGRTLITHFCIDCGKKIAKYSAKRCKKCWGKWETKENNPNYIHGGGYEPYTKEFNKTLKEQIRTSDNRMCMICGKNEKQLIRKLDVHHIDYDKENLKKKNLISLCQKCHLKTNSNRDYWFAYFTYIMESR